MPNVKTKRKPGRPGRYTLELADKILARLESGETLRSICRDEGMPTWRTVYDWIKTKEDFSARFARARELGFDAIAEQCFDIADDEQHDWAMSKKGPITNDVAIARAKLQIETRLKLLARWAPQKYGDKSSVAITGENGGPVEITETVRLARLKSLMALAKKRGYTEDE